MIPQLGTTGRLGSQVDMPVRSQAQSAASPQGTPQRPQTPATVRRSKASLNRHAVELSRLSRTCRKYP
jgi:hypothetical protein